MTKILINGKKSDNSINATTVAGLVDEFISAQPNQIILSLNIDGKEFNPDEASLANLNLTEVGVLNFEMNHRLTVLLDSINTSLDYINLIAENINTYKEKLNLNDSAQAEDQFVKTFDMVDLFTQLLSTVNYSLKKIDKNFSRSNAQQDAEIHLVHSLKLIYKAKQLNDIVMLSDLLEYELLDNLNRWKNEILPQLKDKLIEKESTIFMDR